MKFSYKKIIAIISILFYQPVFAVDSTQVKTLDLQPKTESFLLAQGTVTSNPANNSAPIAPVVLTNRCSPGSQPVFKSSLQGTYENWFYATGGIVNTLSLDNNYQISGVIYMSNRGAVGGNRYSPVTMNWQVWCGEPNQTA